MIFKGSLRRLGKPEEVAEFIRFLSSDSACWITGQLLNIDGGFLAHLPTTVPIAELIAGMSRQTE